MFISIVFTFSLNHQHIYAVTKQAPVAYLARRRLFARLAPQGSLSAPRTVRTLLWRNAYKFKLIRI